MDVNVNLYYIDLSICIISLKLYYAMRPCHPRASSPASQSIEISILKARSDELDQPKSPSRSNKFPSQIPPLSPLPLYLGAAAFQKSQLIADTSLIPAAIHKADCIPPLLRLNHPPTIAPTNRNTTPPMRRLRLTLDVGLSVIFGSEAISK